MVLCRILRLIITLVHPGSESSVQPPPGQDRDVDEAPRALAPRSGELAADHWGLARRCQSRVRRLREHAHTPFPTWCPAYCQSQACCQLHQGAVFFCSLHSSNRSIAIPDSDLVYLIQSSRPRAPRADNLTGNGVPTSIG